MWKYYVLKNMELIRSIDLNSYINIIGSGSRDHSELILKNITVSGSEGSILKVTNFKKVSFLDLSVKNVSLTETQFIYVSDFD